MFFEIFFSKFLNISVDFAIFILLLDIPDLLTKRQHLVRIH